MTFLTTKPQASIALFSLKVNALLKFYRRTLLTNTSCFLYLRNSLNVQISLLTYKLLVSMTGRPEPTPSTNGNLCSLLINMYLTDAKN